MKTLIIVESPAKAKKIQGYFKNNQTIVKSSFGHIIDLPKKSLSIDIEKNFKPLYAPIEGKNKIIAELKKYKKNYQILLAADDDREGDAIAWHCGKIMNLKFTDKNRIIFHEISKKAIDKSMKNIHCLNMNSVNAQQCRRVIDRLVGYSLSPCLWRHIDSKNSSSGLSAGRVQSVLLSILKDHEKKIELFDSEYSYDFRGLFTYAEGNDLECELLFHLDEIDPLNIMNLLKMDRKYKIQELKLSEEKKYPGSPLITSTLQQCSQNELGYPVKMTMDIAQKLYENGKITYMRTDSTFISKDFQETIYEKIKNDYSEEYYKEFSSKKKKIKGAQEAHECIRPTDINHKLNNNWSEVEKKLYNLIMKRTIISHMKPALYDITTIDLINENLDSIGYFRGKSRVLKFDGYLIYSKIKTEEPFQLEKDTLFTLKISLCRDIETNPPQYYNESGIVKKLESTGIGRPSTYASIISTILNRNYTQCITIPEKEREIDIIKLDEQDNISEGVEKKLIPSQKNRILLTDLGKDVLLYLFKHFSNIINIEFTSYIEEDLDRVAEGSLNWVDVIRKVYNSFYKDVEIQMRLGNSKKNIHMKDDIHLGKYKGKDVLIKEGKYGPYLNYDTKNTSLKYLLEKKEKKLLTIDDIKDLIDYPMRIGKYNKKEIKIMIGPYGKYMKYDGKNIKIPQKENYILDELIRFI
ncbi:MAG: DNA topoisomerase 1 [Flavobacteriales bacterium]|nr:DNA topoisomerase 1 [Flavobacteriales bacterium]|tara:strand:+ start:1861 stop:3939 length:2079 start_codon:yes stop_codon:yes gene_type:complete